MLGVGCGGQPIWPIWACKLFQKAPLRSFIVLKLSHPSQKSVWDDLDCVIFHLWREVSLPKVGSNGVQNRNFTPDPRTFTKMSGILFRTPLIFSGTGERLLEIDLLAGISTQVHPAHLGASRQKLSVQGCLHICNKGSWILKYIFLHWGKTFGRNGWPDSKLPSRPCKTCCNT